MLLQKASLRIKQFVSNRKSIISEDSRSGIQYQEFSSTTNDSKRSFGTASSLSQSHAELPAFQEPSNVSSQATATSSTNSLYGCGSISNPGAINHSLSGFPSPPAAVEILYLPLFSSAVSSGDARQWRLIFSEQISQISEIRRQSKKESVTTSVSEATCNLLEALAFDPIDNDITPTQRIRIKHSSNMDSPTDNVGQLIRETDEAFKAVGIALADAKASGSDWYDSDLMVPIMPRTRLKASTSASQSRSPISRSKSVVKSQRKQPYRRKTKQVIKDGPKSTRSSKKTPARWTLTNVTTNVVEVFNGKAFRTEVDELLTPNRIQQLKDEAKKVETERNLILLSKSNLDKDKDIPLNPLEDFLLPSPRTTLSTKPSEDRGSGAAVANLPGAPPSTGGVRVSGALSLSCPDRSADRTSHRPLILPTIPEVSPFDFGPPQDYRSSKENGRPQESSESFPGHLLLPSTNFTLTSRLFRHGPIHIEYKPKRRRDSLPEEMLDWTAFQMAISGTMHDYDDNGDDAKENPGELDVDDIIAWFETFGFDSAGRLIRERSMRDLPMAYLNDSCNPETPYFDGSDEQKVAVEDESAKDPKRDQRDTVFALSVPILSEDELDEVIPMGFNLKHDLGAFLNWEAQHMQIIFDDAE